jgi:DNA-binding NarL/FixJ family response regulator
MSIRVLLVDDQNLVKMGICSLLQLRGDIEVVGQLDDGCEVLESVKLLKPDLLLLDIRMPRMNGLEVLHALKDAGELVPTLILTTFDEHELLLDCARLGAKGYIRKDVRLEELMSAVDSLIAGETWYQPGITQQIVKHSDFNPDPAKAIEQLTKGEIQVLRLAAAGYSNHEIAQALFKSEGTVRNLMSMVLAKLDARDRTRAVLKAIELGII